MTEQQELKTQIEQLTKMNKQLEQKIEEQYNENKWQGELYEKEMESLNDDISKLRLIELVYEEYKENAQKEQDAMKQTIMQLTSKVESLESEIQMQKEDSLRMVSQPSMLKPSPSKVEFHELSVVKAEEEIKKLQTKISDLQTQLAIKEEQMADYKGQIARLQQQTTTLTTEVIQLREETANNREQKNQLYAKIAEIDKLRKNDESLKADLARMKQENQVLKQNLTEQIEVNVRQQNLYEESQRLITKESSSKVTANYREVKSQLTLQDTQISSLQRDKSNLSLQNQDLTKKLDDLSDVVIQCSNYQDEISQLKLILESKKLQISEQENQILHLNVHKERLVVAEARIVEQDGEIAQLQQSNFQIQAKLNNSLEQNRHQEWKINNMRMLQEDYYAYCYRFNVHLKQSQQAVKEADAQTLICRQQLNNSRAEAVRLQNQIEQDRQLILKLESQIENHKAQQLKLQAEIDDHIAQFNVLKVHNVDLEEQIKGLTRDLYDRDAQIRKLNEQVAGRDQEILDLQYSIKQLKDQVVKTTTQMKLESEQMQKLFTNVLNGPLDKTGEMNFYNKQLETYKGQIINLRVEKEKSKEYQKEIKTLKSKLSQCENALSKQLLPKHQAAPEDPLRELHDLKVQFQIVSLDKKRLEQQVSMQKHQLIASQKESNDMRENVARLEAQNKEILSNINELRKETFKMSGDKSKAQARIINQQQKDAQLIELEAKRKEEQISTLIKQNENLLLQVKSFKERQQLFQFQPYPNEVSKYQEENELLRDRIRILEVQWNMDKKQLEEEIKALSLEVQSKRRGGSSVERRCDTSSFLSQGKPKKLEDIPTFRAYVGHSLSPKPDAQRTPTNQNLYQTMQTLTHQLEQIQGEIQHQMQVKANKAKYRESAQKLKSSPSLIFLEKQNHRITMLLQHNRKPSRISNQSRTPPPLNLRIRTHESHDKS